MVCIMFKHTLYVAIKRDNVEEINLVIWCDNFFNFKKKKENCLTK